MGTLREGIFKTGLVHQVLGVCVCARVRTSVCGIGWMIFTIYLDFNNLSLKKKNFFPTSLVIVSVRLERVAYVTRSCRILEPASPHNNNDKLTH